MRQVEVSRTIVFDHPRRARSFFEALVADNLGVGRPAQVAILFARQVRTTTNSRVKQYLKQGKALRIETVINKPYDIGSWPAWSIYPSWSPRPERSTVVC